MPNIQILLYVLLALFSANTYAESVFIHTDNLIDYEALKLKKSDDNLTVATNLYALQHNFPSIKFEYMTTKRSLLYMDEGQNICIVNRIKTKERLAKYIFSKPINLFLGRRLYQHAASAPLVNVNSIDNRVNLNELFTKKPDAQILITEQISYGDLLDAQLDTIPDDNKLIRYGGEYEFGIINMFAKERAEFALLYPHQVFKDLSEYQLRSYEIESIPPYVLGHLMCTKNEKMTAFINKIDQHLNS